MDYKLGKKLAVRPHGLATMAAYTTSKLPPAPASFLPPTSVSWNMDLNDQLGDCVMAGVDHIIASNNAVLHVVDFRPDDDQIRTEYFTDTGGSDTGLVEHDILNKWQTQGIFNSKIAAYAPIESDEMSVQQQAIAFYAVMYGIACPASAQQQGLETPWTVVDGSPIEGGHCIVPVGYDPNYVYCVTWGGIARVTYPFLSKYLDEVWCLIPQQMVEVKGDSLGIDLASLQADIKNLDPWF